MGIKESIGWTDRTCNPILGKCPGGCWYCYYSGKRGIANRFKHNPLKRLHLPAFDKLPKVPKKVFLCSTHDLFGDWIPKVWREYIFYEIKNRPQHTFQILTKFPHNIDRPMPDNVHLGISIGDDYGKARERTVKFIEYIKKNDGFYFMSLEPLIYSNISLIAVERLLFPYFKWIIIGRLTGYGKKYDPPKKHIEWIVCCCKEWDIPIFLKDNLIPILGKEYVMKHREFPE